MKLGLMDYLSLHCRPFYFIFMYMTKFEGFIQSIVRCGFRRIKIRLQNWPVQCAIHLKGDQCWYYFLTLLFSRKLYEVLVWPVTLSRVAYIKGKNRHNLLQSSSPCWSLRYRLCSVIRAIVVECKLSYLITVMNFYRFLRVD